MDPLNPATDATLHSANLAITADVWDASIAEFAEVDCARSALSLDTDVFTAGINSALQRWPRCDVQATAPLPCRSRLPGNRIARE